MRARRWIGVCATLALGTGAAGDELHSEAALGVGVLGRDFAPEPSGIARYRSRPVAALRLEGEVAPLDHLAIAFTVDRSVQMTSKVDGARLPTAMGRADATLAWRTRLGAWSVDGMAGVGHRAFRIDGESLMPGPDSSYTYVVAGAAAAWRVAGSLRLRSRAAFEPVVAGEQPTEAAYGPARRFGVALQVGVEWEVMPWLLARLDAEAQRFEWRWSAAGARGAGGGSDTYAGASAAIGARF